MDDPTKRLMRILTGMVECLDALIPPADPMVKRAMNNDLPSDEAPDIPPEGTPLSESAKKDVIDNLTKEAVRLVLKLPDDAEIVRVTSVEYDVVIREPMGNGKIFGDPAYSSHRTYHRRLRIE